MEPYKQYQPNDIDKKIIENLLNLINAISVKEGESNLTAKGIVAEVAGIARNDLNSNYNNMNRYINCKRELKLERIERIVTYCKDTYCSDEDDIVITALRDFADSACKKYWYVDFKIPEKDNSNTGAQANNKQSHAFDDALISFMKDAVKNSRWQEIIKFGTALSDVLWYTGRKQLRIKMGEFVKTAAKETKNKDLHASVLIDDIGNTLMNMEDSEDNIIDALITIEEGRFIAERIQNHYLTARGHRNKAACLGKLVKLSDGKEEENYFADAQEEIKNAITEAKSMQIITAADGEKQWEMLAAIDYINAKAYYYYENYREADIHFNCAIEEYRQMIEQGLDYKDKIVKCYRAMGDNYYELFKELEKEYRVALDNGKDEESRKIIKELQKFKQEAMHNFEDGCEEAETLQNYDNIVLCCCSRIKLLIDSNELSDIKKWENKASLNIEMVESKDIIKLYDDTMQNVKNIEGEL